LRVSVTSLLTKSWKMVKLYIRYEALLNGVSVDTLNRAEPYSSMLTWLEQAQTGEIFAVLCP
jgi:hypothetical protein